MYIRTYLERVTLLRVSRCTCIAKSAFIFLGRAFTASCSSVVCTCTHTYIHVRYERVGSKHRLKLATVYKAPSVLQSN